MLIFRLNIFVYIKCKTCNHDNISNNEPIRNKLRQCTDIANTMDKFFTGEYTTAKKITVPENLNNSTVKKAIYTFH